MKCFRCGVEIAYPLPLTYESEFCSDACENGELEELSEFLNRLRILRSIDLCEVPNMSSQAWLDFQTSPYEYLISCPDAEAEHIWTALRKREEGDA